MSYAIRFLPVDKRDPSPALYLARDPRRPNRHGARLTSVAVDVSAETRRAGAFLLGAPYIEWRCERDRLRADVVPLADALTDCNDVELRP